MTSLRSHGKWGDMIVGLLPISWCLNILISSNLLLRFIDYQTEANVFFFRIKGRQWSWLYKIDLSNADKEFTIFSKLGRDRLYTSKDFNNAFTSLQKMTSMVYENDYWHSKSFIAKFDELRAQRMVSSRPAQAPQFQVDFQSSTFAIDNLNALRGDLNSWSSLVTTDSIKPISLKAFRVPSSKITKLGFTSYKKAFLTPLSSVDDLVPSLFIFDNLKLRVHGNYITKMGTNSLIRSKQTGHLRSVLTFSKAPVYRTIPLFNSRYFFNYTLSTESHSFFNNRPRSWSLEAKVSNPSRLFEVVTSHGAKKISLLDSSTSMRDFSRGIY